MIALVIASCVLVVVLVALAWQIGRDHGRRETEALLSASLTALSAAHRADRRITREELTQIAQTCRSIT